MSGQALPVPTLARPLVSWPQQVSVEERIALMAYDLLSHAETVKEIRETFREFKPKEGK